jgi:hypothetical protein
VVCVGHDVVMGTFGGRGVTIGTGQAHLLGITVEMVVIGGGGGKIVLCVFVVECVIIVAEVGTHVGVVTVEGM